MATHPLDYNSAAEPFNYRHLSGVVYALLPKPRPRGMRLLDVGCGNGFWAGQFAKLGYTVVGIDPSETGIQQARLAYPGGRFESMEATADMCQQLGEEPFDLVVSFEVVEHLHSPRQWAAGCHSALKAGGKLICSTPYYGYLKNLALSFTGRWDRHFSPNWDGGHVKFWSRTTLTELLISAGFQRRGMVFRGAGRAPFLWKSMVLSALK